MNCKYCQRDIGQCTHSALHEEIAQYRAQEAARQKIEPSTGVVMVRSLVSNRNQKPRIDIQVGEIHTQMDTDSAMDLAKNIIECAEGSYADAFIVNFLQEKVGLDLDRATMVLVDFRDYRQKLKDEFDQLQKSIE